jgi:hypothetical protein
MFGETENMAEVDDDAFAVCMLCVLPTSPGGSSFGTATGNGTEQQESTIILGLPVMTLRVLSRKYKLHHVCTKVSRLDALADGSSFRTWRPREKAERRATPTSVQALQWSAHLPLEEDSSLG